MALHVPRLESLTGDGPRVHLIIDQAALLRPIAPAPVLRGQLRHLIAVSRATAVTVQVAGPAAARAVLSPAFTLLTFAGSTDAEITCCEGPGGQVITTARAGDVRAAHATFDALARSALPAASSAEVIENLTHG